MITLSLKMFRYYFQLPQPILIYWWMRIRFQLLKVAMCHSFVVFQNEIKMFASPQHGTGQLPTVFKRSLLKFRWVWCCNMFIEKNGRNSCFGQLTIKGWSSVSPSRLIALYQKGHTAAKKCRTWPEKEEEEESVAAPFLKRLTTRSNWDWRGVKQHTVHSALLLNCLSHSVYNLVTLATTENHLFISTNVNQ